MPIYSSALAWLIAALAATKNEVVKPNALFIVVDDLRIDLPIYGQQHVHAPSLAKLASESLVFDRAYCNQAVCSPSRASFLRRSIDER